jgi:lipoprotein-releasing system permease protein
MKTLPREWWRLSAYWLLNLKSRTPPARQALFKHSLKVALLGLAIGVGALSVTLAIVTGFEWTLSQAVARAGGAVVHQLNWRSMEDLEAMAAKAPEGVESYEIFWNTQGLITGPKGGRGVQIEGRRSYKSPSMKLQPGELAPANDGSVEVSLGKPLALYLGVEPGDSVRLLLPGILRGSIPARVRRVVSFGMHEIDSRYAAVDDRSLRPRLQELDPQTYSQRPGDAHGIRFELDPRFLGPAGVPALDKWKSDYMAIVKAMPKGDEDPWMRTWFEQRKNLFGSVQLDKQILTVILSLLTLVAALNVAAVLVILFLERDREIAVVQALGLSRFQLIQWVGSQGLLIGVVASAVGVGLGMLFGRLLQVLPFARLPSDIYNLDRLPLRYEFAEQSWVFGFGVLAATFIALFLGGRLSRMSLLQVLGQRR